MSTVFDFPPAAEAHRGRDHRIVAKTLHWITAALIGGMAASGVAMTQLGGGPAADILMNGHKLFGFAILLLLTLRLGWRVASRGARLWSQRGPARFAHRALYAVAILTCLLGLAGISDFGAREALFGIVLPPIWPEGAGHSGLLLSAHGYFAFGLLALVCLHVGFALQDYIARGQRR